MSRIDMSVQTALLKEAEDYFQGIMLLDGDTVSKKSEITLTQAHIVEWLEVFYEDRIKMDTCNDAKVRR